MRGYHAILLAAGAGSRFGGRKILSPWQGEPLIRAAASVALAAPVESCVAVTGCDAEEVEAALAGLDATRLQIRRAGNWQDGIAASLGTGLAGLPPDCCGTVVFLGDMPLVPLGAAARLIGALRSGYAGAELLFNGAPAHPVAYARSLFSDLEALRGDTGGRRILAGRPDMARIETDDPGATFDIDHPIDSARDPAIQAGI